VIHLRRADFLARSRAAPESDRGVPPRAPVDGRCASASSRSRRAARGGQLPLACTVEGLQVGGLLPSRITRACQVEKKKREEKEKEINCVTEMVTVGSTIVREQVEDRGGRGALDPAEASMTRVPQSSALSTLMPRPPTKTSTRSPAWNHDLPRSRGASVRIDSGVEAGVPSGRPCTNPISHSDRLDPSTRERATARMLLSLSDYEIGGASPPHFPSKPDPARHQAVGEGRNPAALTVGPRWQVAGGPRGPALLRPGDEPPLTARRRAATS